MPIDPSIIITTVGGATSNSYVTLDAFIAYADLQLNGDTFRDASSDDRIRALLMAAKRLNRENWLGTPVNADQALAWPRDDVKKPDHVRNYGLNYWNDEYRTDEIPELVQEAQYELALAYLNGFERKGEREIDEFQSDGIRIKYATSGGDEADLPLRVAKLIAGLIRGNRLVRG